MNNSSENTLGDASSSVEVRPLSVGTMLREAREQLGLSVVDVESRLKFASRQIEALEADNFTLLSETSFVRRFIRSYAKLLQLDPEPLLASLPIAPTQPSLHSASTAIDVPLPNTYVLRGLKIIWLAIGFVVVSIILLFVWLNRSQSITPQARVETVGLPTVMPTIPASVVVAVPLSDALIVSQQAPAAAEAIQTKSNDASKQSGAIRLMFDAESWVKVTDNDGNILLSKLNARGSEQHLKGRPPFSVVIGNVSGVRLYYQEKLVELAPYYNGGIVRLTLE
ncbi:MAG: RodZ domain-containing protein [Candidatus Nitrotoga sp.]